LISLLDGNKNEKVVMTTVLLYTKRTEIWTWMRRLDIVVYVESTEPRVILERLLEESVPAQRRNMRYHPNARKETLDSNPLMRCGADYAFFVNGRPVIAIERKFMPDAVCSLIPCPKRPRPSIFRQLEAIKVFPIRALLLEGQLTRDMLRYDPELMGMQYWCLRNGVFVFHTSGIGGTIKALKVIYKRIKMAEPSLNPFDPTTIN
jgi:ERCC4-type nuclease